MPTIDVSDAAARLLANKTVTPGHCLEYVSRAIRNGLQPLIWSGLDTALNCWNLACTDKRDSRTVPLGFPAFLGSNRYSKAGDVIISRGDGTFAATDWPRWGVVGVCTLEQRENQTGRKYLGYAGQFLGYALTNTATASVTVTPINAPTGQEEESDMKIVSVPNGTIALIGEYNSTVYGTTSGGQGFSIGTNKKAYGEVTGLTNDEVMTLVNEANGRRATLVAEVVRALPVSNATSASAADIAAALAPLIVPAIVSAVGADTDLTEAQVQAATESAVRAVFADAATK